METLKNKRVIRMIIIFMLLVLFSKIPIIDKINSIGKFVSHSQINYSNVITVTSRDGSPQVTKGINAFPLPNAAAIFLFMDILPSVSGNCCTILISTS